jgi:hypothetical protein
VKQASQLSVLADGFAKYKKTGQCNRPAFHSRPLYKMACDTHLKHVFLPKTGHGGLQFPNRAKIRPDSMDITMLP